MSLEINSSFASVFPTTSVPIQLLNREGFVVVGTNDDDSSWFIYFTLRFPLKLKSVYSFPFYIIYCINLVKTCSIYKFVVTLVYFKGLSLTVRK